MAETVEVAPKTKPSWGLVLIRIAIGAFLVNAGWHKISEGVGDELVLGTKEAFAKAPEFVRTWGENVVLAHPAVFKNLITWGEFLGGIALLLGGLVRPAGLLLAFMFANFYFAGPEEAKYFVGLLSICCFACFLSRAGRRLGADAVLEGKLPRWMTW